jgi:hypothetical protein
MGKDDEMNGAIKKLSATCCLIPGAALIMLLDLSLPFTAGAAEVIYVTPPPPARVYVQPPPVRVVPAPPPQYGYGQRRAVTDIYDAGRIMGQYYHGRDVRIGPIREHELFYQADVRDRRGALLDKIILDKRTGRIRSTY